MKRKPPAEADAAILRDGGDARYDLHLYVTGPTPQSMRAIVNIRKICEQHLGGRYDLEVVDLSQNPAAAAAEQIIAAPTLVKKMPLPVRRFIGDLSETARVLAGLDLRAQDAP